MTDDQALANAENLVRLVFGAAEKHGDTPEEALLLLKLAVHISEAAVLFSNDAAARELAEQGRVTLIAAQAATAKDFTKHLERFERLKPRLAAQHAETLERLNFKPSAPAS